MAYTRGAASTARNRHYAIDKKRGNCLAYETLLLRVHGNQLGPGPGVQLAVELGAAAVDHCTHLSDTDIEVLAASQTVATLLPGVEFSTRSPYPNARRLIDAGATVALATDCNPGTSYSTSIPLMVALAVREMSRHPPKAYNPLGRGSGPTMDCARPAHFSSLPSSGYLLYFAILFR